MFIADSDPCGLCAFVTIIALFGHSIMNISYGRHDRQYQFHALPCVVKCITNEYLELCKLVSINVSNCMIDGLMQPFWNTAVGR